MEIAIKKPITGGGLGDFKVGFFQITDITGYKKEGIDIGATGDSVFAMSDGGYFVAVKDGKLVFPSLEDSTQDEIDSYIEKNKDYINGISIMVVVKG